MKRERKNGKKNSSSSFFFFKVTDHLAIPSENSKLQQTLQKKYIIILVFYVNMIKRKCKQGNLGAGPS